ncbi:unnamed protein product [Ixodes persulcatus]
MTAFVQKSNPHEQNVKTAEIKMSAFVAEHALSFKAMDHLGELAKVVFHDSAIAKGAAKEDRIVAAELILKDMNPITEAYLKFMQYVLGFFNKLNAMFQSKDSLIAVIQEESQRLLRCLCQNFMKPSSIEDPAKLNPLDPRSLLDLEELYVGAGCQGILDKITMEGGSSEVRDFKLRCMSFYQTAVLEVQKRLSISGPFFHEVRFVQPSTALS